MAYRRGRSPLLVGVRVGIGVWIVGYLVALAIVPMVPSLGSSGFTGPGFAAAMYVAGSFFAVLVLVGPGGLPPFYLLFLLPSLVGLLVAVAGGAIVAAKTERLDSGWGAAKAGAAVGLGVCLMTMTVLAVYLVPSTPVSNTRVSTRYFVLFFGNLLLPALFGALGGTIQHAIAARDEDTERHRDPHHASQREGDS